MGKKTVYPGRLEAVEALEAKARKEIKHYFTDWTQYDRPALLDPEQTPNGSKQYLLTRECGSYLLDPEARPETAFSILDYYLDSRTPEIRNLREIRISAERVTVETVDPWKMLETWKRKAAGDPAQLAEELNVKELLSA